MNKIDFQEDVGTLDTILAVNKVLKPYGMEFVDAEPSHDEAVAWELKVEKNAVEKLKELVKKAPLGYYQGRLIKHKSTSEQDVVNWLVELHKLVE